MRKLNLLLMGIFTLASATAQNSVDKYAAFHLSFVPPLSTNGIKANEYTNGASLICWLVYQEMKIIFHLPD